MYGSARNFLRIMVQVSATTFIFNFSMNLASSPQIQAINTVSDTAPRITEVCGHFGFLVTFTFTE